MLVQDSRALATFFCWRPRRSDTCAGPGWPHYDNRVDLTRI